MIVLKKVCLWIRKEKILCIAAVCAAATMFFVPPDGEYIAYIDLRVLCLLFCLMAVVVGFQHCGVFPWLAARLLRRSKSGCTLGAVLVLLPLFAAMLVTNDVALLTFVPFTMAFLQQIGCSRGIILILVLQTIAANLGSMATPVGNPQNLFLYSAYELSAGAFFSVMIPLTLVSLVCLAGASVLVLPKQLPTPQLEGSIHSPERLIVYFALFGLCILTVFRVLPYGALAVLVLAAIAMLDRSILKELDYALLITFVCFFVVSGNLGRMESVQSFLQTLLAKNTLLTAVAASQVISNVPAAVLLSAFTNEWKALLAGVNIGGLGTPIASLASLITLKLYLAVPGAKAGRFLAVFTAANLVGLLLLLTVSML